MAVQLTTVLANGDITDIKKDGTGVPEEVLNRSEVQAEITSALETPEAYKDFDTTLVSAPAHVEGRVFW